MTGGKTARLRDILRLGGKAGRSSEKEDLQPVWQLMQAGRYEAAEEACRRIVRAKPRHVEANHCLGALYQRAGRHEEAVSQFEKVLAAAPGNVPAHANLADSLRELDRFDAAGLVLDRALRLFADSPAAYRNLGDACLRLCRYSDAAECYRKALAAEPADIRNHLALALSLRQLGRADEALACYDKAAALQPNDPGILVRRGNVLCELGRLNDAIAAYRKSIRLRPDYARTYELLASARRHTAYDADLKATETLYNHPTTSPGDRMLLAFGLGKAFEDLRQYDKAFGFFLEANRLRRSLIPYSISQDKELFAQLKSAFDAEFFAHHKGLGSEDHSAIFVLGIPRSGTSLVEQILASHPLVYGAGELPDMEIVCKGVMNTLPAGLARLTSADWRRLAESYLVRLRTRTESHPYVTDKMPQNFLRIGMIATMLPNARIIHCRRDPIDTCLSAFKSFFATAGVEWCYGLDDTGRYYCLYRDLMDHWHRLLPGRICDVQYEDLVANPEHEIRRLLAACGLPFDANCLSFHRSKRPIRTRSFAQTRRPIYRDSVRSWKQYESHLQSLITMLDKTSSGAGRSSESAAE